MSLNNDTPIRRRRGRSEQRAVAQVERRKDSAGRDFQYRRQVSPPIIPPGPGKLPEDGDATIVVTQVRTITPTTAISRTSTTSRSSTTTSSRTTTTSSSSSTLSSVTPETTFTLPGSPPVTTSPSSSSSTNPANPTSAGSNANGSAVGAQGGLSSGAIAGIAIAVVVVLAALIAFLVRRRMIANRAEKRGNWLDKSGFSQPPPPFMAPSNVGNASVTPFQPYGPPPPAPEPYESEAPRLSYSQPIPYSYPVPPPPPPSIPFATSSRPASLIPGRGGIGSPTPSMAPFQSSAVPIPVPVVPPPVPPPASNPPLANTLTVRCTFIPSMGDELSITTGETIQVLEEYDDGWALCLNGRGERGMVPMECLETDVAGSKDKPGLSRSSSLSGKS